MLQQFYESSVNDKLVTLHHGEFREVFSPGDRKFKSGRVLLNAEMESGNIMLCYQGTNLPRDDKLYAGDCGPECIGGGDFFYASVYNQSNPRGFIYGLLEVGDLFTVPDYLGPIRSDTAGVKCIIQYFNSQPFLKSIIDANRYFDFFDRINSFTHPFSFYSFRNQNQAILYPHYHTMDKKEKAVVTDYRDLFVTNLSKAIKKYHTNYVPKVAKTDPIENLSGIIGLLFFCISKSTGACRSLSLTSGDIEAYQGLQQIYIDSHFPIETTFIKDGIDVTTRYSKKVKVWPEGYDAFGMADYHEGIWMTNGPIDWSVTEVEPPIVWTLQSDGASKEKGEDDSTLAKMWILGQNLDFPDVKIWSIW